MADEFDDIFKNPFHQIVFKEKMTDEEKSEAIAAAVAFDATSNQERNLAKIDQVKVFKDYVRNERVKLARELSKFVMSSPVKETIARAQNVNNELQSVFAVLDKGMAAAGNDAADKMVVAKPDDGFAEYFHILDRLIRETRETYSAHSANAGLLKEIADMPPAKDTEARVKLSRFLEAEAATPAEQAFFFDTALLKPIAVRGALRFKTPSM